MIKQTLFSKIKRMEINKKYQITEKLDGSNLGIANISYNLYIIQRNTIIDQYELYEQKNLLYKGLYDFIKEHGLELLDAIQNGTVIFGEWLGMGKIKYNNMKQFNLFAKAQIEYNYNFYDGITTFSIENLDFEVDKLKYAFKNENIPSFISLVPTIDNDLELINKQTLDELYDKYSKSQDRIIEGFVILDESEPGYIRKYVRCKNGQIKEHFQWENI
ncbi:RNA ligase family protein [Sneathia sanguinegens]|uniref:RNA ligase family protein n=1 Tax=Sneathia sanguinegens TaxID=40543 RepID=UPI002586D09A|nr:RNA ligase family protein [Sneathia sanguinegens]MDU4652149.1 RNA ligase family protein [Sneathia sanguinegens]